jgi:hypothetical protein
MARAPMAGRDDKSDFVAWLKIQNSPEARYAIQRWSTASIYNMTGHFHSEFFGIRAFLRAHPRYRGTLAGVTWSRAFWKSHAALEADFARFVRANWASYPGQRGGDWRKKLPPWLGGTQRRGGAGSGLVSRMLILLDRYGQQRGY